MQTFFLEIISQNSTKKHLVCLQYHLKFSHCENLILIFWQYQLFLMGKCVFWKKKSTSIYRHVQWNLSKQNPFVTNCYPLANEVAKGYSNATVRPSVVRLSFRNILVNTLESTSFNGFDQTWYIFSP